MKLILERPLKQVCIRRYLYRIDVYIKYIYCMRNVVIRHVAMIDYILFILDRGNS